jgi:uncharacterized membrane protein YraQ (UPF0718 family)
MKILNQYKWSILLLTILFGLYLVNNEFGTKATVNSVLNLKEMLMLVPPIFIIMGLLDVWVPKEMLIKYMGHKAGISGLLIAFLLGTAAAGPLYVAFPIGQMLLKKGARPAYVIFFLGIWSSTKLPILLFEVASLGLKFTLIHIAISVPAYLMIAYLIEKSITSEDLNLLVNKAQ